MTHSGQALLSPSHTAQHPVTLGKNNGNATNHLSKSKLPILQSSALNGSVLANKRPPISDKSSGASSEMTRQSSQSRCPSAEGGDNTVPHTTNATLHSENLAGDERFDFSKSNPGDPWHQTFRQLMSLTARMDNIDKSIAKIDNIGKTTTKIASELEGLLTKTAKIERDLGANTTKIQGLGNALTSLKTGVGSELKAYKDKLQGMKKRSRPSRHS